jgi:hypothetical protein
MLSELRLAVFLIEAICGNRGCLDLLSYKSHSLSNPMIIKTLATEPSISFLFVINVISYT